MKAIPFARTIGPSWSLILSSTVQEDLDFAIIFAAIWYLEVGGIVWLKGIGLFGDWKKFNLLIFSFFEKPDQRPENLLNQEN